MQVEFEAEVVFVMPAWARGGGGQERSGVGIGTG